MNIVKGDARRSLEAAPDHAYDLLVLDAFSSDTVPVHLITKEAIELYDRVLRPDGAMVFNVSNRFYDLQGLSRPPHAPPGWPPSGANTARPPRPPERTRRSRRMGSVGQPDAIAGFAAARLDRSCRPGPVLSDDFADLLQLLRPLP